MKFKESAKRNKYLMVRKLQTYCKWSEVWTTLEDTFEGKFGVDLAKLLEKEDFNRVESAYKTLKELVNLIKRAKV